MAGGTVRYGSSAGFYTSSVVTRVFLCISKGKICKILKILKILKICKQNAKYTKSRLNLRQSGHISNTRQMFKSCQILIFSAFHFPGGAKSVCKFFLSVLCVEVLPLSNSASSKVSSLLL